MAQLGALKVAKRPRIIAGTAVLTLTWYAYFFSLYVSENDDSSMWPLAHT